MTSFVTIIIIIIIIRDITISLDVAHQNNVGLGLM